MLTRPTLLIGETEKEMNTSVGVADKILKFSNERIKLGVDDFLEEHIKILATAFDTTPDEIKNKVPLTVVITKYLDILEYIARIITQAAESLEQRELNFEGTAAKNENTKLYH